MTLHEQHEDFLGSNICYFGCLHNHFKWTTPRHNKTVILDQEVHWTPIPETTYSIEFLFHKLVAKGHVRLYFCKAVSSATLYFDCIFCPPTPKNQKRFNDFFMLASNRVPMSPSFSSTNTCPFEMYFCPAPIPYYAFLLWYYESLFFTALYCRDTSYETFYGISSTKNVVHRYRIWIIYVQYYISFLISTIFYNTANCICMYLEETNHIRHQRYRDTPAVNRRWGTNF
jgi:hypothetical protein